MQNTFITDYGMFTSAGNCAVAEVVREARELAGVDGPANPVQQAINYMLNELEYLGKEHFEEATDTAVREAALAEFFAEDATVWTAEESAAVEKYMSD